MTRTEYYGLYKPEQYEDYNVDAFNDNFDIIDQTMHEIASPETGNIGLLGFGYGVIQRVEDNIAYCYIPNYRPTKGAQVTIFFPDHGLDEGGKLSISSSGPYPIYIQGKDIVAGDIQAGTYYNFTFDGEAYRVVTVGSGGGSSEGVPLFIGTQEEYRTARSEGRIIEGMLVAITDDFEDTEQVAEEIKKIGYPVE